MPEHLVKYCVICRRSRGPRGNNLFTVGANFVTATSAQIEVFDTSMDESTRGVIIEQVEEIYGTEVVGEAE